ncbi:MAG: GNAT family N-acetyltransferase [Candidatus Babeliales bacterium]
MKRFVMVYLVLNIITLLSHDSEKHTTLPKVRSFDFEFIAMHEKDFKQIYEWLHRPFIEPWFIPKSLSWTDFLSIYSAKLTTEFEWNYLIYSHEEPIGYIRYYDAHREPDGIGNLEPEGSYGIELFIGESEYLQKGYGTTILSLFMEKIILDQKKLGRNVERFIIDPNIHNIPAYRTYSKVGFSKVREFEDPYYGPLLIMEFYPN